MYIYIYLNTCACAQETYTITTSRDLKHQQGLHDKIWELSTVQAFLATPVWTFTILVFPPVYPTLCPKKPTLKPPWAYNQVWHSKEIARLCPKTPCCRTGPWREESTLQPFPAALAANSASHTAVDPPERLNGRTALGGHLHRPPGFWFIELQGVPFD